MTRQICLRVLMSLLLLFSQQMATSHVISHLSGAADIASFEPEATDAEKKRSLAQDQSCNKCLVFAQLAAPLGAGAPQFTLPVQTALPVDGAVTAAEHARTILAFQSRAPPQA